jgi:tRNA A37 methylthiotransferase MiaB
MDVTGVFGYSDEDGTEAASYDGKLDEDEVRARAEHVTALVEELNAQRAEERVGERVSVLVESLDTEDGLAAEGRAAHQGPEVDGTTALESVPAGTRVGDLLDAVVVAAEGVDLVARPMGSQ